MENAKENGRNDRTECESCTCCEIPTQGEDERGSEFNADGKESEYKTDSDVQNNQCDITRLVDKGTIPRSRLIHYESCVTCAEKLTDLTILLARSILTGTRPEVQPEFEKVAQKSPIWPTVGELSILSGLKALEEYVASLDCDITLKYCINFVSQVVDNMSTTFIYQVKASVPTKKEPVQLITANMYFFLKAYNVHPRESTVEVTYTYENSSLVYRPDEVKFREYWLVNIMDCKTEFSRRYGFKIETFI